MNTIQMYDAQVDTITMEDISNDHNNKVILHRIKRNSNHENNKLYIQHQREEGEYVPAGAYDMGWLGYFVGKNEHLEQLYFGPFASVDMEVIQPFLRGVNNNKSINKLNFYNMDLMGGRIFSMMGQFFKNSNLEELSIENCSLGVEGSRLLALALSSCTNNSLRELSLITADIADEGLVDIITALSMHPNMRRLDFDGSCLETNGCKALATLLENSITRLQTLDLSSSELNDEGIDALVPALKSCNHLKSLSLSDNTSITTRGWQQVASILKAPNSNLNNLYLTRNNIDEEALTVFANALINNQTFKTISLGSGTPISIEGEASRAFTKLLCDTTSVNLTYLSNHTLKHVLEERTGVTLLKPLLILNRRRDKKEVAMIKILKHHNDFDMTPFFEWEFKVLPLMIGWFERASAIDMSGGFDTNIGPRKLSSIYQFVRGMPLDYVEVRLKKELEDIKAEEMRKEQELAILAERKRIIIDRLGRR